jgi:hypothetical protein
MTEQATSMSASWVNGYFSSRVFSFRNWWSQARGSFDKPARFAQAAAMSGATLRQEGLYPLFLIALRCGSES